MSAHLDKPSLSGYLVCPVYLVGIMQPNKPNRLNRPNEQEARIVAQPGLMPEEQWKLLNSCEMSG
jgi:hypothetical protein